MSLRDDLNYLVKLVAKEENFPELFKIIFSCDDGIDQQQMLDFINESVNNEPDAPILLAAVIDSLQEDKTLFDSFLSELHAETSRRFRRASGYNPVPGKIYNETMTPGIFWMMMAISMKKCLGTEHAKDTLDFQELCNNFQSLNDEQKRTHKECVGFFNLNADRFTFKNNKYLGIFLHKFHSKNKQVRTRKKNLHRVTRRVKKMMQVYRLSHNNNRRSMFSDGRHEIPDQFDGFLCSEFFF